MMVVRRIGLRRILRFFCGRLFVRVVRMGILRLCRGIRLFRLMLLGGFWRIRRFVLNMVRILLLVAMLFMLGSLLRIFIIMIIRFRGG